MDERESGLAPELAARAAAIRREMERRGLDALVLTSRVNVEYVSGFRSLFWTSKSRPFFAVLWRDEDLGIVIASAGEARNARDIPGPFRAVHYEGFLEEALALLAATIRAGARAPKRIALDYGADHFGRGSLELLRRLEAAWPGSDVVEGADAIWRVRLIKSDYELAMKREACRIADRAFFDALAGVAEGTTEIELRRDMHARMIRGGAERVDWLPVIFGTEDFAYTRPPSARPLRPGNYIWSDIGCVFEGYYSDFNRIAKAGPARRKERDAYRFVRELTIGLAEDVRPGMTCGELYDLYERRWSRGGFGTVFAGYGRIGHGSGMDMTEPPSIMAGSRVVIEPGMVLHLEPKVEALGGVFQVEETFVVGEGGNAFLTELSPPELPRVL